MKKNKGGNNMNEEVINEPVSNVKEIYKYVTDDNSKLFSFNIDGDKIIVKRYNLTLDKEKIFS